MNMCSSWEEENARIEASYIDCWPLLRQQKRKSKGKLTEANGSSYTGEWNHDKMHGQIQFQPQGENAAVQIRQYENGVLLPSS